MAGGDRGTQTSSFGAGRRENHDASRFYQRFTPPELSDDEHVNRPDDLIDRLGRGRVHHGSIDEVGALPESSVALVVTSPPYFVGKDYELAVSGDGGSDGGGVPSTYLDYLEMLRRVFAECCRVLEPGGRIAVNVANLGRKPYRSLSADVTAILQDDLGLLLRGEVIWEKGSASSGSCAWGSFARASNPVLRDLTERIIVASKGRFARAGKVQVRRRRGLPWESTLTNDEFVETTRDVWRIDAESARRVGHPAPFPVELPRRLIDLYTYRGDLVVDPFAGSGTTLVAAARTGRIGIGFDTDADYVALAEQRLADELAGVDTRAALVATTTAAGELTEARAGAGGAGGGSSALEVGEAEVASLSPDDRQELFQARAVAEGRKVEDIALRVLTEAGFSLIEQRPRTPVRQVDVAYRVGGVDAGAGFWVEVAGAFTTSRPGLQRADAVWRLLGRLHLLRHGADRPPPTSRQRRVTAAAAENLPVLVLTPSAPRPGSPADLALRAAGPNLVFDVIELYDDAGCARLRHYAEELAAGGAGGGPDGTAPASASASASAGVGGSGPAGAGNGRWLRALPGHWTAVELDDARLVGDPDGAARSGPGRHRQDRPGASEGAPA